MKGGWRIALAGIALTAAIVGAAGGMHAQPASDQMTQEAAKLLAPTGKLRVGVLMVWYFALEDNTSGELKGVIPDLGAALARRIGVPVEFSKHVNPGSVMDAFRSNAIDVTFIGITGDRALVMDYGPTVIDLQTTFLVPAASKITSIAEIDQPGLRILVPRLSAQEAYLRKIVTKATLINVAVETPKQAVDLIAAGEADAFSHVVPMLASAQPSLPGSRILPGSYYNVPVAVAVARGRPAAAAELARSFVVEAKASGLVQQAIERAKLSGVVVSPP